MNPDDRPKSWLEDSTLRSAESQSSPTRDADAHASVRLDFLQPSSRSDSLGRLGNYEIIEVVGCGTFGIVLKAFDEVLRRIVAIKVMKPEIASTSPARKRFLREARASASIRHKNVVHLYAVEEKPLPYLVMEFVSGETIQHRLDATGPLEVKNVIRIGEQIASGLAAAHAIGLIHRDIKPSNILLESADRDQIKLTDFGLARAADDARMTQSGVIVGTPMYMSPEQAVGVNVDHRTDLFSLGSVMYAMASGRPPFRAPGTFAVLKRVAEESPRPIPEILQTVPDWLCHIISKLHAKRPEDRYQTAAEVAALLGRCESEVQRGIVPAVRRFEDRSPPSRSRRTLARLVGVVAIVLLAAGVYLGSAIRSRVGLVANAIQPVTQPELRLGPLIRQGCMGDGALADVSYDAQADLVTLYANGGSPHLWVNFPDAAQTEMTLQSKIRIINPLNAGFVKLVFVPAQGVEVYAILGNLGTGHKVWIEFANRNRRDEEGFAIPAIGNSGWIDLKFIISDKSYSVFLADECVLESPRSERAQGYAVIAAAGWRIEMKDLRATFAGQ